MPATQRGQVDRIKPGHWRLRWRGEDGKRHGKQPFRSKSAAWAWYRANVEPQLNGEIAKPEPTLSEFIPIYLERHGATGVRPRTISSLQERLVHAERAFRQHPATRTGAHEWRDCIMAGPALPERSRYGVVGALRQALEAATRWGQMDRNPAKLAGRNRQPAPRSVRVYSNAELDGIAAEMSPMYAPLPMLAAATGLRPEEWEALERKDIDRTAGILNVRRTISSGEVVELGKTARSRRQVPLSPRALAALDALPPRLDTPLLFASPDGKLLHHVNFSHRQWRPAIASGVRTPARIYDMRHTFASNSLAAGVSMFELAKIMGTSALMIERVYGSLLDGAAASIARRLAAFEEGS